MRKKTLQLKALVLIFVVFTVLVLPIFTLTPTICVKYENQPFMTKTINIQDGVVGWKSMSVVSNDSTENSLSPAITVDIQGNIHVAWQDKSPIFGAGSESNIFYRFLNTTTGIWAGRINSTDVISTETAGAIGAYYPDIAVGPDGNVHIVWFEDSDYAGSGSDYDIFYKFYNASTGLWAGNVNATDLISTGSAEYSSDPAIVITSFFGGEVNIVWVDEDPRGGSSTDADIFFRRWDSDGWGEINEVSAYSDDTSSVPDITVDKFGVLYVVWSDLGIDGDVDYDIYLRISESGGSSWSGAPPLPNQFDLVSVDCDGLSSNPSIAIDSHCNIHIVWGDATNWDGQNDDDIYYRMWNKSNWEWSDILVISNTSTSHAGHPQIVIDGDDNIYVVWEDQTDWDGEADFDIYYNFWNRTTGLWNGTAVISKESTSNSQSAVAAIGISPDAGTLNETLHVIWHEPSNITGCGPDYDIFYSRLKQLPIAPLLIAIDIQSQTATESQLRIDWTADPRANLFYIYRNTSDITSIDLLTPIGNSTNPYYFDTVTDGKYYYVIVGMNDVGHGPISNCLTITVKWVPQNDEFFWWILVIIVSIILVVIVTYYYYSKRKNKQKK
ncbi:MAG: hypothetical protein EU536_02600 [Promethearchaeota archaeon]|nr:MAG: hypothetical protein EU536_02600 [Candidatus Lokiarchaeota archaeon]